MYELYTCISFQRNKKNCSVLKTSFLYFKILRYQHLERLSQVHAPRQREKQITQTLRFAL